MEEKIFLSKYYSNFANLIKADNDIVKTLSKIYKEILRIKKKNKKVLIFGNGGGAYIASHFSLDLTNVAKIRCLSLNDPGLVTCFSNDFGFEKWIKTTINYYYDTGDLLILISSSGKSKNMLNAAKELKIIKNSKIVTLTGFNSNNPLKKLGDINLWINSNSYNFIENTHQIWLLSIVDLIGKKSF